jgi:glycosyltransferase involved in cell wall biosynthesis
MHSAHLLVARNLEPLYDNTTAIRAFRLVQTHWPAARLTIAGSGPQEAELRQLVVDLGLQASVHFTGRLDRDAMAALYREADTMLNPSLADNMPNSVLESMASGVPVVSTNVGGVPYIVQDGVTALLVPPGDAQAMAAACLRLLDDADLWRRLQQAGLAEVQRYTWRQVAPVLAAHYRQAIKTK